MGTIRERNSNLGLEIHNSAMTFLIEIKLCYSGTYNWSALTKVSRQTCYMEVMVPTIGPLTDKQEINEWMVPTIGPN